MNSKYIDIGKRIGGTKYSYISEYMDSRGKTFYKGKIVIKGKRTTVKNIDLKQCAINLDKKLIENGMNPVNVLIKK